MTTAWSLSRRLTAGTLACGALIALGLLTIALSLSAANRAEQTQADRIVPARQDATELLLALVDQETGLRGYALGRDPTYLQPYRDGVVRETQLRGRLERLIGKGSDARAALLALDVERQRWHDDYQQPGLKDLEVGAAPRVDVRTGKLLFDHVRSAAAVLDGTLSRQLTDSRAHVRGLNELLGAVLVSVSVVILLGLLMLRRALRSWVTAPLGDLRAQVRAVASGERTRVLEPTGPLELVLLGADVEQMRGELVAALADIERARVDLEHRSAELARSNSDLEQFAYVASHDLQEPLRKVASFCQLLEQRYAERLDERGLQYLEFAVDGSKRMQRLISDLLTFSRVGRSSEGFTKVRIDEVVASAWKALDQRVQDNDARLEMVGRGAVVHGDPSLLHLLLQNLLGNAVKYRRDDRPPIVRVTTTVGADVVEVVVADNGIGIAEKYAEKVFVIFQRLHGRDEYEGTGIGLALCKKVVEFHGGTIGLTESALGGTAVRFTLPRESQR